MNFLAHCLIAAKAGATEAAAHPSRQAIQNLPSGVLLSPPTAAYAKRPDQSEKGGDASHSTTKPSKVAKPTAARGNSKPSSAELGNGCDKVLGLTEGLIVGGLLGDFIKGRVPPGWPKTLQWGVRLHRRIDAYSNAAPELRRSSARFPPELRRFAPIFIDIIADHCLALDWANHHHEALPAFSARCCNMAAAEAHRLDGNGRRYLSWLIDEDLMAGYRHRSVMERGLLSVTRRLARQHLNGSLLNFVDGALPSLKADFQVYFPLLVAHGRGYVEDSLSKQG